MLQAIDGNFVERSRQNQPQSILMMFRSAAVFSILSTTVAFRQVARFGSAKTLSMALKESDSIPNVVFKARVRDEKIGGSNPFTWKDVSTSDIFKGKRSVVFALPGGTLFILPELGSCLSAAELLLIILSVHPHLLVHSSSWLREALWYVGNYRADLHAFVSPVFYSQNVLFIRGDQKAGRG